MHLKIRFLSLKIQHPTLSLFALLLQAMEIKISHFSFFACSFFKLVSISFTKVLSIAWKIAIGVNVITIKSGITILLPREVKATFVATSCFAAILILEIRAAILSQNQEKERLIVARSMLNIATTALHELLIVVLVM